MTSKRTDTSFQDARTQPVFTVWNHNLLEHEVPIGAYISLALPTARWGAAGLASFASPANRTGAAPGYVQLPDRWWMIRTLDGQLQIFARVETIPFTDQELKGPVSLHSSDVSVAGIRSRLEMVAQLMDELAPTFFAQQLGDVRRRLQLDLLLKEHLGADLLEWHRALAPDFFRWLSS